MNTVSERTGPSSLAERIVDTNQIANKHLAGVQVTRVGTGTYEHNTHTHLAPNTDPNKCSLRVLGHLGSSWVQLGALGQQLESSRCGVSLQLSV